MKITERQLRRIIRDIIIESENKKDKSIKESNVASAYLAMRGSRNNDSDSNDQGKKSTKTTFSPSQMRGGQRHRDYSYQKIKLFGKEFSRVFDESESGNLYMPRPVLEAVMDAYMKHFMHEPELLEPKEWAEKNIPEPETGELSENYMSDLIKSLGIVRDEILQYMRMRKKLGGRREPGEYKMLRRNILSSRDAVWYKNLKKYED